MNHKELPMTRFRADITRSFACTIDQVQHENRILKAELVEAKALLQLGQAKIQDLLQENLDLELKRDLRSQAKPANFGTAIHVDQTAAFLHRFAASLSPCTGASCEDGPAPIAPKVPTLDVRVWRGESRLVGANRRAAMRALQTGTSLPGYAAEVRFATADGRTLTAEDIDWTGFGLQPIISAHRVLVLGKRGLLDPSFERDAVLAEFHRTGSLPTGYQFPLKYWNLKPQDVNFAVGAKVLGA